MNRHTESQDTHEFGLRLLALGKFFSVSPSQFAFEKLGGGIKGLSELLILQRLMEKIQLAANLNSEPRPCDYFDMIAGSGGGGWVISLL
jgi:hypothetical protein